MINEEMVALTKELVGIASINTTAGERDIAIFIENYLRSIPYFKEHPDQVIIQPLTGDQLGRRNVMALLMGEKHPNAKTIIWHGHTDTVGIDDYGVLRDFATQPDLLKAKMQEMQLDPEVTRDLESGDYLFGRGSCDMKSGDAVFLVLLKQLCLKVGELSGNILVSFNPVEENLHTGIIESLDVLEQLGQERGLEYVLAINNDFICPLFPGDQVKTIYTGTVGKLLPCFYIQGKETHVGQCFEGFDAALVAAELTSSISLNNDFADGYEGEFTYPPSVLKMKDLKPWYNVQTTAEAFVYFNYFVHNASIDEITAKLQNAAQAAMAKVMAKTNASATAFARLSQQAVSEHHYELMTLTFAQLNEMVAQEHPQIAGELEEMATKQQKDGVDAREIAIAMIRVLLQKANLKNPVSVLYYAPPYCPHNKLQGEDAKIITQLQEIVARTQAVAGDEFRFMKFFPSLSDSSYLKIDDASESLELLQSNFPGMAQLYPLPLDQIKRLNIPAVNFGCYGKDAHKWTERVHIPYTFGTLPLLLEHTIEYYLKS